jgi:hypothetical protein
MIECDGFGELEPSSTVEWVHGGDSPGCYDTRSTITLHDYEVWPAISPLSSLYDILS